MRKACAAEANLKIIKRNSFYKLQLSTAKSSWIKIFQGIFLSTRGKADTLKSMLNLLLIKF